MKMSREKIISVEGFLKKWTLLKIYIKGHLQLLNKSANVLFSVGMG